MIRVQSPQTLVINGQSSEGGRFDVPLVITSANIRAKVRLTNNYRGRKRKGKLIASKVGDSQRHIIPPEGSVTILLRGRQLDVFAVD